MRMDARIDRKDAEFSPRGGEAEIDMTASAAPTKNWPKTGQKPAKNRPKDRARDALAIKDTLINGSQQIRLAG